MLIWSQKPENSFNYVNNDVKFSDNSLTEENLFAIMCKTHQRKAMYIQVHRGEIGNGKKKNVKGC